MNQIIKASNRLMVAMIALLFASCVGDSGLGESINPLTYSIQINSKDEVYFERARAKVKLFGTARNISDNAATLLSDTVLSINKMPSTLNLQWPEYDYQLITSPPVSVQDDAVYYFDITIDLDGNSVICANDFVQNYDETPFFTIDGKPLSTIEFYVTLSNNESCQLF